MKKAVFIGAALLVTLASVAAQSAGLDPMLKNYAARNFVSGLVSKADLDLIIQAGIRAPSASNKQPWFFTAVESPDLAKKLIPGTNDGNVIIVISAENAENPRVALDCALAAENIYLAAQALGYGSRIYTGPVDAVNRSLKSDLGLPKNRDAVVLVRIGRLPSGTDALSSASSRKSEKEIVTRK
jgi:nitroreductase